MQRIYFIYFIYQYTKNGLNVCSASILHNFVYHTFHLGIKLYTPSFGTIYIASSFMGGPVQIGRARISFNSPQVPPCKECIERASSAKDISDNFSLLYIWPVWDKYKLQFWILLNILSGSTHTDQLVALEGSLGQIHLAIWDK